MSTQDNTLPCPRCDDGDAVAIATSPVRGAWEIYQCAACMYFWRSTEPRRRTDRALYPEEFRMTRAEIEDAPQVPTVPPLRTPS